VHQSSLSARDELIAAIYGAAAEVLPASRPLELLAAMTRSDKAFAARFNFEQRSGAMVASFNVEPHYVDSYKTLYAHENPWLARASYFQAEGLVWRGSDIVEHSRLTDTSFFKLFMYGQVIEKTAQLVIRVRGPEVIHVMLTRRPQSDEYDDATLEICRVYALHARRALEIGGAVDASRWMQNGIECAANELAAGMALVELPSTIRYVNEVGQALFADSRNGVPAKRWALPGGANRRPPVTARLPRQLIEVLAQRPMPRSCVIERDVADSRRPIFVEIRPAVFGNEADALVPNSVVIVCRDADVGIEIDEAALRKAFHLTPAEARVCAALVSGENVHALALRLNISPQTARTHVKHIFEKTYTTRQSELMKLLMSIARRKEAKPLPAEKAPPLAGTEVWPLPSQRRGTLSGDD